MGKFIVCPKNKYQASYKIFIFTHNICKVQARIMKQAPERKQAVTMQYLQRDKHGGWGGSVSYKPFKINLNFRQGTLRELFVPQYRI